MLMAFALIARPVSATPIAQYNPATGNVRIYMDIQDPYHPGTFSVVTVKSRSANAFVEDLSAYTPPHPTSFIDTSELSENTVSYLRVPLGWSNFGNIVVAGTPTTDLYLPAKRFTDMPGYLQTEFVTVPEPISLGPRIAAGLIIAAAVRRRHNYLS